MKFLSLFLSLLLVFSIDMNAELSNQQKREFKKTVENMRGVLPRRINAMTTMIDSRMEGSTLIFTAQIDTAGRQMTPYAKTYMSDYVKDQYCRPPYEYLDAGLIIETKYYDEKGKYLLTATASKRICGR
jgi:hypothetical protein